MAASSSENTRSRLPRSVAVHAVVVAGDGRAAKAIYGESKAYLKVAGRSMLARAVAVLQRVPEVSEVWVVGNAARLEATLKVEVQLVKPLVVVPQYRNLLENAWQTYRRLLPHAGPGGRDPESEAESDLPVLYLSADLPFATAEEISAFVRAGLALDCDYVLGLVPESSLVDFYPSATAPGIQMACFHTAEDRYRHSNLHLVRPARLGNRVAIEHMYEHRYQKQLGQMLGLAWHILNNEGRASRILFDYALMHLALLFERLHLHRLADWLRRRVPLARIERACAALLGTRLRFAITRAGGCAVDVDNERDLEVARARFADWTALQQQRARALYGALPAPAGGGGGGSLRVLPASPERVKA